MIAVSPNESQQADALDTILLCNNMPNISKKVVNLYISVTFLCYDVIDVRDTSY